MPARSPPSSTARSRATSNASLLACSRASNRSRVAKLAAEWEKDNWVRSRTRRQFDRARRFLKERHDYRAMAAGPG